MSEFRWVLVGDSRVKLKELFDGSVDSVVTDPPYELGFMGKSWDSTGVAYDVELWGEVLRVLKPGGHLLAFGGSRTYHRLASAIEDAGFEIRDQIMWVYGSGFPKSLNVSKAIDKMVGAEREVVGVGTSGKSRHVLNAANTPDTFGGEYEITAASSDEAKQWEGWGTALKPAHEPIVLARKPLNGTVANNVLQHGTGALNIDGCRVGNEGGTYNSRAALPSPNGIYGDGLRGGEVLPLNAGRWPANLIHDGSDEVLELFPHTASTGNGTRTGNRRGGGGGVSVGLAGTKYAADGYADGGSAARFFYCAKANKKDRNEGLDEFEVGQAKGGGGGIGDYLDDVNSASGKYGSEKAPQRNHHPTVKPTELMRYLCKLITPPNGLVLDPFTGSGSTGKAAILEGFNFIGIEQSEEYARIAEARIRHVS